jgi:hypothetical protein
MAEAMLQRVILLLLLFVAARVLRCVGHSSAVRHLDWSADGSCIQSMDQAYEVRPCTAVRLGGVVALFALALSHCSQLPVK